MRVLFAGNPGIGAPCLETLAALPTVELVGVLTNPDAPRKRSGKNEPTEISVLATALSAQRTAQGHPPLTQFKMERLNAQARETVTKVKVDLLVTFAYGRIFGPQFLALFPYGGINIHPSLLPKYRGPTPLQATILNQDAETGITIQRLALEIDAGQVLAQERLPVRPRETAASLSETVAQKSAVLLQAVLEGLRQNSLREKPQTGEVTYCTLLSKNDGRIPWAASAREIDAQIRAYTPYPLSWTTIRQGQPLYILEAAPFEDVVAGYDLGTTPPSAVVPGKVLGTHPHAGVLVQTGHGVLGVTRLQYQMRKALDWRDFCNGTRTFLNATLE